MNDVSRKRVRFACESELRRDPGIPNSCPFKADILANVARRKAEREALIYQQREERRMETEQMAQAIAGMDATKPDLVDVDERQKLEQMVKQAKEATATFEANSEVSLDIGPSGETDFHRSENQSIVALFHLVK